ncbi:hypothetical protein GCM10018966_061710 [Streptomyces yanii]
MPIRGTVVSGLAAANAASGASAPIVVTPTTTAPAAGTALACAGVFLEVVQLQRQVIAGSRSCRCRPTCLVLPGVGPPGVVDPDAGLCVQALEKDIRNWIKIWNEDPKLFVWTKTADEILERLAGQLNRIPDSGH